MINHRVHSFIMLLMAFLHNDRAKAMVILAIHLLVLDKVLGRIYGIVHSLKSPTKGLSEFEILDDETLRVSIPVKTSKTDPTPWYRLFLFKYGTWLAGLHVYLNVRKVDFFQHHPFALQVYLNLVKLLWLSKEKRVYKEIVRQGQNNARPTTRQRNFRNRPQHC